MIKRYCDRCGEPADNKSTHIIDKKTKTEIWVQIKTEKILLNHEADLCPECIRSFSLWWITRDRKNGGLP